MRNRCLGMQTPSTDTQRRGWWAAKNGKAPIDLTSAQPPWSAPAPLIQAPLPPSSPAPPFHHPPTQPPIPAPSTKQHALDQFHQSITNVSFHFSSPEMAEWAQIHKRWNSSPVTAARITVTITAIKRITLLIKKKKRITLKGKKKHSFPRTF